MTTSPGGGERDDIDALFADIVARWDDPPDEARAGASTERPAPPLDPASPRPRDPAAGHDPSSADASSADSPPVSDVFPASDVSPTSEASPTSDVSPTSGATPAHEPMPQPAETAAWRQHVPPEDDDEEGFVPPPPSPLPPVLTDWSFYLALVGLVGGPLWLLYLVFVTPTEHRQMWAAGALTIAGFVTLVLRQPHDRDPDDDDDGARV
ncbi:hypothetical protein [Mobilicoccus massiliensis]|uniref:hypothetical protein n=1 Tax=Mobilicoccus massiliensis TaxID=1522310 RepID=UPI0006938583|nr:hypothetical protein [Mobilicoccus massiliensis]